MGFAGTFFQAVVFICFGMVAGALFSIFSLFSKSMKNNLIVTFVSDFFAPIVSVVVFLIALFRFESGKISVFSVLSFLIGLLFVLLFVQNLFVKGIKAVYNKVKLKKKS